MVVQKTKKVLVLISTKDRVQSLQNAVESILNQTYEDYRLVVIDDGSTDRTWNYLEELKGLNPEVTVERNETSLGPTLAKTKWTLESREEYIAILDDDDWWEKDYLERMIELAKILPLANMITCNYYAWLPSGKIREKKIKADSIKFEAMPSHTLLKGDTFRKLEGWDNSMPYVADLEYYIRARLSFAIEPKSLVNRTISNTSMSSNKTQYRKDFRKMLKKHKSFFEERPKLLEEYKNYLRGKTR